MSAVDKAIMSCQSGQFIKNMAADMLPFISWNKYEEMLKSSKVKVTEQLDLDKNNNDNSGSDGNVDDEFL